MRDNRVPLYIAAGVLAGFLVGFAWQYMSARGYRGELERTEHALTFKRIEATLAAATIEAQRGSFEVARQLASQFFSGLQENIGRAAPGEAPVFTEILARRDVLITALSRNDPQSGPLLAQLFTRYRTAVGEPVGPSDATLPAPTVRDTVADPAADTAAAR
jgi:hypothetical protein